MTRAGLHLWAVAVALVTLLALPGALGATGIPGAVGEPGSAAYTRSR